MLKQKVPLVFPGRQRFVYDPGVADRQLWAIEMVVVQWSMLETFIDISIRNLIEKDDAAKAEFGKRTLPFQLQLAFWKTQVEDKGRDPWRSHMLSLIPRTQALSAQRDEVVHRLWAGGSEGSSPSSAGLGTLDAGMMPNAGEKTRSSEKGGLIPFKWRADFARLRKMATDIADLNRDMMAASFLPNAAHGFVDRGS